MLYYREGTTTTNSSTEKTVSIVKTYNECAHAEKRPPISKRHWFILITTPTSFCSANWHPHCPNHYNAFRPIPLQVHSPPHAPQQLLVTIGVPSNTSMFEIASTISKTSSNITIPITNYAHSHALTTHPLLPLLLNITLPNCCLQPLLIPDPQPHIRPFLVTLTTIPPTRRYPYVPLPNLRHHPNLLPPATSPLEVPHLSGPLPVLRTSSSPLVVNYLLVDGAPRIPRASSSFD